MNHSTASARPESSPSERTAADAPLVTFEQVKESPRSRVYVRRADEALAQIGYTEHGERHVGLVSRIAFNVLKRLGYPERDCELAAIAGYLHDIGNAVNRDHHAQTGAAMAMQILH
jgi:putative nucleotidyltransferase with HDIG domain